MADDRPRRRSMPLVQGELERLRAENTRLREALDDAISCVEDWAAYANDYFKEKWDLAGDLARLRAALVEQTETKTETQTEEQPP